MSFISLVFSKNIEQRFIDLGGKIFFNSEVLKINIKNDIFESITLKNNTVKGVILEDGEKIYSDRVIVVICSNP